jgi:hypothetical protein
MALGIWAILGGIICLVGFSYITILAFGENDPSVDE